MTTTGSAPGSPEPAATAAWLLVAADAAGPGGPVEWRDLVAAADAARHAILTRDELAVGLGFLVGHGFIEMQGTAPVVTDRGRAMLRQADCRTWSGTVDRLRALLAPLGPTDRYEVPASVLEDAVADYLRRSTGDAGDATVG